MLDLASKNSEEIVDNDEVKTVSPKNKLNALTASEWIARTISVFVQKGHGKGSPEAIFERQHPAPFSYQDVLKFIEMFTKPGDLVFDPFVGIGSTLKACSVSGRNGLGVELSPTYSALARQRIDETQGVEGVDQTIINMDIRTAIPAIDDESLDFVVTSPPYWGILNKIDHKANQDRIAKGLDHNYGRSADDIAHIADYEDFVEELSDIFCKISKKLKPKKYMVIIVGDFRHKDRYMMFHSDLSKAIERNKEMAVKGLTIIYQKFKRVFPYGYPHAFVPNIHHQYAIILQKI